MNVSRAIALAMMLGLLATSGRAQEEYEANWHGPRDRSAPPPTPAAYLSAPTPYADAMPLPTTLPANQPPLPMPAVPSAKDDLSLPRDQNPLKPMPPLPPKPFTQLPPLPPQHDVWKAATTREPAPRVEVTAEYLLWWSKAPNSGPPLLTTSPPNGLNGVPGAVPGSLVLLSAGDVSNTFRDGGRLGFTYWLDDCQNRGIDARIFLTGGRNDSFLATSAEFPNGLFRPFFIGNPIVPGGPPVGPFREVVTGPGLTTGGFEAQSHSQFWGAEANYRGTLCRSGNCDRSLWVDPLVGFRYLNFDESLTMTEGVTRLVANPAFPDEIAGTRIINQDRFATYNDFYGGQVGTIVGYSRDRLSVDLRTTIALGATHEKLKINGAQVRAIPGGPTLFFEGGLLALPSNIGSFSRNVFAVAPELGLNVGYQLTEHVRAFVGYDFLYLSNVIRPGDQIDTVLDVNQIPRFVNVPPGTIPPVVPPRPAARFNDTDFWAQGVNFGLAFQW
jgi:hypothetical protein